MDTLLLALRVLVSLGAVLAVLWFARRWLTGGKAARTRGKEITVVAKQGLGAKASVALVEAGGARYLLGVTEHSVTVLDRLEPEVPLLQAAPPTTPIKLPSFARELEQATAETGLREPIPLVPASRRSAREAEAAGRSPLAGSLLSADTWRQTALALRRAR
ncbi:MAG TPA: flagellar biosynthetic protein FliO [Naasia sp.]|jgi:flagellar protein FliO/FliZ